MTTSDLVLEQLAELIRKHDWPGLGVALVHPDGSGFAGGIGVADLGTRRAVTDSTGYRIGSTGKTMTGLALMRLVEDGTVGLEDEVAAHVPHYAVSTPAPPLRLSHLVTHTGGLGEVRGWSDLLRHRAGIAVRPGRPVAPLDELYRRGLRAAHPPGLLWRYANHGISVLGSVLETHTGTPFEAAVEDLVLYPLGMRSTSFRTGWGTDPLTAQGYDTKRKPVRYDEVSIPPAGSTVSRPSDMLRYLDALLGSGAPVVRPETFSRMVRRAHQPDVRQTGTGVLWWLNELGGHRIFRHGGSFPGFRSFLAVAPDDGVALWLGLNADDDGLEHAGLDLVRRVLGLPSAAAEVGALAEVAPETPLPRSGRYTPVGSALTTMGTWSGLRGGLHLDVHDGAASLRAGSWPKRLRLHPIGDGLFATAEGGGYTTPGFLTVQLVGPAERPLLLLDGRTAYQRTDHAVRPWTTTDELTDGARLHLESLLPPSHKSGSAEEVDR